MNLFALNPDGTLDAPFFETNNAAKLPLREVTSYDDVQCRALLNSLGDGWLTTDRARPTCSVSHDQAMQRALFIYSHPTHWLCFVRWEFSPNPDNNGYAMWGIPRAAAKDNADFERQAKAFFSTIRWEIAEVKPLPALGKNYT